MLHLRVRPELRHSHWFPQEPNPLNANINAPEFRIVKNEVSFLLGITFQNFPFAIIGTWHLNAK